MVRIVKEEEHSAKRKEILKAAQHLLASKGYAQMTIQDILDSLQISKGAFYHYFRSKSALLEALVEHMQEEAERLLEPVVQDPHLSALEKLQQVFTMLNRWKLAQKDYLLAMLSVWYDDENAITRQKLATAAVKRFAPLLADIVHQGLKEGVMDTDFPDQAGEVLLSLTQGLGETLAGMLLSNEPSQAVLQRLESTIAAYNHAVERVLGAPKGSLYIVDLATLKEWFESSRQDRL